MYTTSDEHTNVYVCLSFGRCVEIFILHVSQGPMLLLFLLFFAIHMNALQSCLKSTKHIILVAAVVVVVAGMTKRSLSSLEHGVEPFTNHHYTQQPSKKSERRVTQSMLLDRAGPLLSLQWDLYNNNHVANMFVSNFTHYLSRLRIFFNDPVG